MCICTCMYGRFSFLLLRAFMHTRTPSAQTLWDPVGLCGRPWALVGLPGPWWTPLGPCGSLGLLWAGPLRAPHGPLWAGPGGLPEPLWAPWGLVGRALVCPLWPLWAGPLWVPWALVGRALVGPWALMGWALMGHPRLR